MIVGDMMVLNAVLTVSDALDVALPFINVPVPPHEVVSA